jgi:hypothetical protein
MIQSRTNLLYDRIPKVARSQARGFVDQATTDARSIGIARLALGAAACAPPANHHRE